MPASCEVLEIIWAAKARFGDRVALHYILDDEVEGFAIMVREKDNVWRPKCVSLNLEGLLPAIKCPTLDPECYRLLPTLLG